MGSDRGDGHVCSDNPNKRGQPPDLEIRRRADDQHAAITSGQLDECGVRRASIRDRVRNGRLFKLWRGAYCVGHRPLVFETWIAAAVLLTGGVASHLTAAYLWGFRKLREREAVHVTAPKTARNRPEKPADDDHPFQPALITHRGPLDPRWTRRNNIKVTSAERTLLDCAGTEPYKDARRMVGQALVKKRVSIHSLLQELDRQPGHHGQRAIRHIILTAEPTRSEAEDLLNELLKEHGIRGFEANVRVPGVGELDFFNAQLSLALEFDSREFHDNPLARADDRAKTRRAEAQGIAVNRYRWRDITVNRRQTAAQLRNLTEGSLLREP